MDILGILGRSAFFLISFLKGNIGGVDLGERWQEEKLGRVVGGETRVDI